MANLGNFKNLICGHCQCTPPFFIGTHATYSECDLYMGISVELWRARIGSFHCRASTPCRRHYAGVSGIAARLAADPASCKHHKVSEPGAIFLLRVIVNGTRVLLRMVSRHLLVRLFKMADPDTKTLQLSSRTALLLCGSRTDLGAVMRVMLVTASLTVTRDAMIHLLAALQCNQAHPADYGMFIATNTNVPH